MIQHDITHRQTAPACPCGRATRLIHAAGRSATDARLFGLPSAQYHVECTACGIASPPMTSVGLALNAWRKGDTITLKQMPALRVALDLSRLTAGAAA